jgi:ferredoxin
VDINSHPRVINIYKLNTLKKYTEKTGWINHNELRELCLNAGADDVGFVEIDRKEIADQLEDILKTLPGTKTLISFVCRQNREPIRNPARSIANLEFHHTVDAVSVTGKRIVAELEERGFKALNPSPGFPMEMNNFPGKTWVVSHKPVAVAAGLGKMGIHRNVIHPKFGNFITLGTILTDAEVTEYNAEIDYNPCLECKLCVATCPVGAIGSDGYFDFSACYTHNYREFMGGFTDWVENIVESKSRKDYREKVNASESASMWQSLSYGANYKAAYCMAVCPAGEDVIVPYLLDKKDFLRKVVNPLQEKIEPIYVVENSDAEEYVAKRFPHKVIRNVSNGLTPTSIRGFLEGLQYVFQRKQSEGINAVYQFEFYGRENAKATIIIKDKKIQVKNGHFENADLIVKADSTTWLKFLAKEKNIFFALLMRKIKIKGSPKLLLAFGKCFPS